LETGRGCLKKTRKSRFEAAPSLFAKGVSRQEKVTGTDRSLAEERFKAICVFSSQAGIPQEQAHHRVQAAGEVDRCISTSILAIKYAFFLVPVKTKVYNPAYGGGVYKRNI
jgi:hypothetical protein